MDVFCDICGHRYHMTDPAITLHPGPQWECADESACADRRAASLVDPEIAAAVAAFTRPFTGDPS
jgi:hypothetical protein